jgi:hypothetical protein
MTRPRGPLIHWWPRRARQKAILADLIARYEQHEADDTLPRGPRGIFYDLRPNGMGNGVTYRKPDSQHPVRAKFGLPGFGPMEAHPESVREVLVLARRAGIIPEHWVADGRAPTPLVPSFDTSAEGVAELIAWQVRNARENFTLDPQRGQPIFIEVLCEPEDLMPRFQRVAAPFGVPIYSGAGFDGLKGKREIAERAMQRDRPTVVLHVGDRDDHGENIYRAAAEDAIAWADGTGEVLPVESGPDDLAEIADEYAGADRGLVFVRLALTRAQGAQLGILDADGKAEADAIPVPVMDKLLTDAIEALQDPGRRNSLLDEEADERERLPELIRDALDQTEDEA